MIRLHNVQPGFSLYRLWPCYMAISLIGIPLTLEFGALISIIVIFAAVIVVGTKARKIQTRPELPYIMTPIPEPAVTEPLMPKHRPVMPHAVFQPANQ